jgi:tyrosyl-tRNA synthetase
MTKSKSEARRMIKQAAVRIDNEKILDMELIVHPGKEVIIKVGKRKFLRVK